jgi:hypothetical protein
MVWCAKTFQSDGEGQFTGLITDEYSQLTVNCEYILLTPKKYLEFIDAVENSSVGSPFDSDQFDVENASEIFGFFFGVTLSLWLFAKCVGVVLQVIRRG